MHKFYNLIFCFFLYVGSFAQVHLFVQSDMEVPLLTQNEDSQIPLLLNFDYFSSIKEVNPCDLTFHMPVFENNFIELNLEAFNPFTNDFQLLRSREDGLIYDNYQPDIQSYRIIGTNLSGSISFMKDILIGG